MGVKYSVNSEFFKSWDKKMAYLLGFIYADGSIYTSVRGNYLAITSTDKHIIYKIKKWLSSGHTISKTPSTWPNGKLRFGIKIGNKDLYDSLIKLGLYPNKSKTIGMPVIPDKFLRDFVRGYFDGDGCVHLYRSGGIKQKTILRKLSVIFTSGSKKFLKNLLRNLRKNMPLKQTKIYRSHRSFQLRLATTDSVEIFKFMYGNRNRDLFFARKFKVFRKYFELRPQRVDNIIRNILQCSNGGHVAK